MEEEMLSVGDTVLWSGAWGTASEQKAVVTHIEVTENQREKYGKAVDSVPWSLVVQNRVVVDLSTGGWAYGYQIRPVE